MAEKIYLVAVRWVETEINPDAVDRAINQHAVDWLRYSGTNWFVESSASARTISNAVQAVLKSHDSVFVAQLGVDVATQLHGFAPQMVWEWWSRKVNFNALTSGLKNKLSFTPDKI